MKIFMAVMVMVMSSAFAGECKLNGECTVADCKLLNTTYGIVDGKCAAPASNEKESQCAAIVSGAGKSSTDAASDTKAEASKAEAK